MEKMKLSEILKNQTITNQFNFSGSCPDKDGETVSFDIFDTPFFMMEVTHNYFNRAAFVDPDNAFTDFLNIFTQWKNTRGPLYARIAYAYSLGYNPIENYSSVEEHSGQDDFVNKKKVTRTWSEDTLTHAYDSETPLAVTRVYDSDNPLKTAVTHDNDKTKTTYNQVKDTSENNRYGVNSATKVPVSEDINTRSGNEEVELLGTRSDTTTGKYSDTTTGKYTDVHSGGYNDENSGTDEQHYGHKITKTGNIGIQTASEMTQKLYDGLIQDLANRGLKEFLERYTFYSEGVDLW